MKKSFCLVIMIIAVMSTEVFLFASTLNEAIFNELQKLNIKVTGPAQEVEVTILNRLPWSLVAAACDAGGYDLSAYMGKNVLDTSSNISKQYGSEPLDVHILSLEYKIACVYETVRKGSQFTPGIFSVNEGN